MTQKSDPAPDETTPGAPAGRVPGRLGELARLFLRLGTTAFGGPAAHIALMEDEVVRRRQWLSREEFLDLLGAANLIPGPNSTEMAIHIGLRRAGGRGLLVAGLCFILPATILVGILAGAYVRWGHVARAEGVLYGVKPVVIAVVAQALWGLGRTALKSGPLIAITLAAAAACFAGWSELGILAGAGVLAVLASRAGRTEAREKAGAFPGLLASSSLAVGAGPAAVPVGLVPLFLFFLKVGAVLYGSGYVLIAFLRADLVDRWHWLSESQLLDAVAVGQITPGPVFTTATFVGYLVAGAPGAMLATVGIFLPAFVFVALSGPLVSRIRSSPAASAFLDGVNVASLALMAVVGWQLARVALIDGLTVAIGAVSAGLLFRGRVNSAWLVLAGAVAGLLGSWLHG